MKDYIMSERMIDVVANRVIDKLSITVDAEDILPIVKILMRYLDKEYYDENADSIWEYDDYKENIQHSIINLMWLRVYMEAHPDVTCYFYDSY